MGGIWEQVDAHLADRAASHLLRRRRVIESAGAVHVRVAGRQLVNFASNDYLGLTHCRQVSDAVMRAIEAHGTGAGAAGLITGYGPEHEAAEREIARWKGTEAAVLLPSGYQANVAAVQTLAAIGELAGGGVRFLVDKLAHASLIDAVRATGAPFRVFPHNGMAKLKRLLSDAPADQLQVVVTESIFSMDGDACDLPALADLKQQYGCLLLLDEAHGTGVYGEQGSGYAAEVGLRDVVDVSVATLSKAIGLVGGAVCARRAFCDLLLNHGRAYIYSTSVPAHVAAGVRAAIGVMLDEPRRQQRVRVLARRVRTAMAGASIEAIGLADSPIVPLVIGDEARALDAARRLEEEGLLVVAVRPPTVPPGGSRLRVTLSCEHSDEEVDRLIRAIVRLGLASK